ncbi:cytochrome P450 [Mycena rosella]|uniref:Cytochrome P450 n=1 Tax=Mycena rosella TaxID=1033263 RepID=A0AAD7DI19_MYCRO|nr:cytochrome P450 [Mycena rosella]
MSPSFLWQGLLHSTPRWWLGIAFLAFLLGLRSFRRRTDLPTPPGPKISMFGLWKGATMPSAFQWLIYGEWKKTYGDLIFLDVLKNPILVINSVEAAQDLLEKRSAIYSSRPIRVMQKDVMGFDFLFTGMKYDAWYKQHRIMFHHHFQRGVIQKYQTLQQKHAYTLLRNLAHAPNALEHIIRRHAISQFHFISLLTPDRRTTAAIVLEICYGIHVADAGDEYVALADEALAGISSSGNFGTFAVDYFPLLKYVPTWLPGANFKREGLKFRRLSSRLLNYAFDSVKQKLEDGCAEPSLMTIELDSLFRDAPKKSRAVERETIIKDVLATTYAAGSDTTLSTLLTFVLAIVLHPDVQAKAWEELDRVVPKDRLPQFEDRDQLPYIMCIVWECLRWQPSVNLAPGHYLTETDEYRGYRIPKGTTCLANIWAMLHDPQHYPDPSKFDPDRYADAKLNHSKNINANPEIAFGFGRRICPGRFFALDTLWIVIASTLYSYRICKALDSHGREMEPRVEYLTGLISLAKPFKYRIVSRGEDTKKLVEATLNEDA